VVLSDVFLVLLVGIAGYLIGAFPTGVVVTRLWGAHDVRQAGSGHSGTTNTYRQAGLLAAALVFVVDLAKGLIAVWLSMALTGYQAWAMPVAGAAAVLGHCWSVYVGFRGGMGVSTAGGIFLWVLPGGVVVFAAIWLAARALLRHFLKGAYRSPLGVIVGLALGAPIALWLWSPPLPVTAYTVAAVIVLLVRHASQIVPAKAIEGHPQAHSSN
jgi:glycerol-3-phosphate acyltransferase PlsY